MGFLSTGYEEAFVRVKTNASSDDDVEMVYLYPEATEARDLLSKSSVLSMSQMTVRYGNLMF